MHRLENVTVVMPNGKTGIVSSVKGGVATILSAGIRYRCNPKYLRIATDSEVVQHLSEGRKKYEVPVPCANELMAATVEAGKHRRSKRSCRALDSMHKAAAYKEFFADD